MKRGDVVLMDYPFSDGTGSKVRPALVVLAIRKTFVIRTLGSLPPAVMHRIDGCLKSALGLS